MYLFIILAVLGLSCSLQDLFIAAQGFCSCGTQAQWL